ncbi:retrotransposon Gag-like protein 3 [Rhinolophus sinicus]|uniref:retrotransposon Gag-like protein 3 n=1 Tax=Rhinolophus sinicus TaxID=89399 RepID=UPI003D7B62BA
MVEDLAASYIALKLENEILQAQVQRLMEENAALQAQIPELQKPQAAKEDEPLQKPSEAQESPKPQESLDPPEFEETQKPREPQELLAWETPAAQETQVTPIAQETQKSLKPAAAPESLELLVTQEPQVPPMVLGFSAAWNFQKPPEAKEPQKTPVAQEAHKPPETKKVQKSQDTQDAPEAQEPQNSDPQDSPNAQELQEAREYQETSIHLEPLEPLESQVPQESLDPSDVQEFLELSAPQESLEDRITIETSAASEFPQSPNGLQAEAFPLEYPLAFNGDAHKLPEFLVQLNSYMRVRGHLYPTEAALVSFVGNRFSGEAGRWFQPLVDIQSPLLEQFESFIRVLQDTFDNPENMEDANHRIRQLCQGEDPVHQYVTHFYLIAQELNWEESTLCIQFQEGLPSSIRDQLSHTSPAINLSDMITQCINLEEKLSGKPDPNPQGASSSEERAGPERPSAENQPVQAASNRPHLSEAERVRRREGHLCLYCGHPGHFARYCPVKPHRAQQAGNMEARR